MSKTALDADLHNVLDHVPFTTHDLRRHDIRPAKLSRRGHICEPIRHSGEGELGRFVTHLQSHSFTSTILFWWLRFAD